MMIRSRYDQPSLLARLWLRLGRFLGKTLLWLVGLGLLGWLASTAWFAWQHSGPVSPDEQIPAGEAAMTQGIIQTAVRIVDQHREGTRYLRDAHAKAHGCVKAEVSVLADLDPALRQGVFAEPGKTWQAMMRLSNGNAYPQFDSIRDARGMALKLLDVPGKQLLADQQARTEQDFVMFSHPNFFVSDVASTRRTSAPRRMARKSWRSSPRPTRAAGRCVTCLSPWQPWHPHRPARRRPPIFRYRPTSSVRPMPSSVWRPTHRAARNTPCPSRTRTCRTSCAAP